MKGVILAGGKGTRLYPLTASTNKHLIPVGDLPMIEYPLNTLIQMGIKEISIVVDGENFTDMARYLERVHKSLDFSYYYQKEAGGVAQALGLAKPSLSGGKIAAILGDNIFEEDFSQTAKEFENSDLEALVFLKPVLESDLYFIDSKGVRRVRYGIAEVKEGRILSIEEKPINPKSNLNVTGLYLYDSTLFDRIKNLKPSARGEYEISDVNGSYIPGGKIGYRTLEGFWSDAGTFPSRRRCEDFLSSSGLQKRLIQSIYGSEKDALLEKNLVTDPELLTNS